MAGEINNINQKFTQTGALGNPSNFNNSLKDAALKEKSYMHEVPEGDAHVGSTDEKDMDIRKMLELERQSRTKSGLTVSPGFIKAMSGDDEVKQPSNDPTISPAFIEAMGGK